MGEEIAFKNGQISDFPGLVSLTLDRVILWATSNKAILCSNCQQLIYKWWSGVKGISNLWAKYCHHISICLYVHSHISETTCPNFTKFSVSATCGHGFFLLWRQPNKLCELLADLSPLTAVDKLVSHRHCVSIAALVADKCIRRCKGGWVGANIFHFALFSKQLRHNRHMQWQQTAHWGKVCHLWLPCVFCKCCTSGTSAT